MPSNKRKKMILIINNKNNKFIEHKTGAYVYLRKKAPLGDPIEITVRGYELTLRKSEADFVLMTTKEN